MYQVYVILEIPKQDSQSFPHIAKFKYWYL